MADKLDPLSLYDELEQYNEQICREIYGSLAIPETVMTSQTTCAASSCTQDVSVESIRAAMASVRQALSELRSESYAAIAMPARLWQRVLADQLNRFPEVPAGFVVERICGVPVYTWETPEQERDLRCEMIARYASTGQRVLWVTEE